MSTEDHDPIEFANSLGHKLASKSRKVKVFLGAGAGVACNLPDVSGLEESILAGMEEPNQSILEEVLQERNLEEALTYIRKIESILDDSDEFAGLTQHRAESLDERICEEIIRALSLDSADIQPMLDFALWANRSHYDSPIEVFTVNYDLLLETAFEATGVNYFDGFVGNLNANFNPEFVESFDRTSENNLPSDFVRLWKIHGSVNWTWADGGIVRKGAAIQNEMPAAIYPSEMKYKESRRVPYQVLQDRFRRSLFEDDIICIICGYSFGDQHLNELFFDAARENPESEFNIFCYNEIPEILAKHAIKYRNIQILTKNEAIIGGDPSEWSLEVEEQEGIWEDDEMMLCDFSHLAKFLSRSATKQEEEFSIDDLTDILDSISD